MTKKITKNDQKNPSKIPQRSLINPSKISVKHSKNDQELPIFLAKRIPQETLKDPSKDPSKDPRSRPTSLTFAACFCADSPIDILRSITAANTNCNQLWLFITKISFHTHFHVQIGSFILVS